MEAGVIQGSVLGFILFILFISDINNYIPDRCTLEKYADDILTYIIGEHDPELPQTIVNAVNQWCIDNQMKLNTAKCKVITFTPKNQAPVKDISHHHHQHPSKTSSKTSHHRQRSSHVKDRTPHSKSSHNTNTLAFYSHQT